MKKILSALVLAVVASVAHAQSTFNKYQPANGVQCNTGSTYVNTACTGSALPAAGSTTQILYNLSGVITGDSQTTVASDLGLLIGAPTGGSKGPGTINATGLFINGAAVGISGGAVSSVGLSLPAIFTVTGSPVTSAGTLTGTLATQTANTIWSGPTTGAAAAPTFRAMVAADLPANGANPSASVGLSAVNGTALTWMRSDAAPALSQTISPTMTGNWTHTPSSGVAIVTNTSGANTSGITLNNSTAGGVELNLCGTSNTSGARCWIERVGSTGTFTLQAADDSGVPEGTALQLSRDTSGNFLGAIIAAPGTGAAATLLLTGSTSGGVLTVNGGNATNSYIRLNTAGTNYGFIGDAFAVFAATTGDLGIGGGGTAIHIGPGAENLNIATTGAVSISPSSGIALTLNAAGSNLALNSRTCTASGACAVFGMAGGTNNPDLQLKFTESTAKATLDFNGSTASVNGSISVNGVDAMTFSANGNVVIPAPASSTALIVNGLSTANTLALSSTGAAQSLGQCWACGINAGQWNIWTSGTDPLTVGTQGAATLGLYTNNIGRLIFSTSGLGTFSNGTHGVLYQFTATVTSGTVNSVACYGGCGSPSTSRTTTGVYVYTHNIGVTSLEWTCSMQNSAGNAPGVYPSVGTGATTSNALTIDFYNSTGSLTDPAASSQVTCTAASPV